MPALNLKPAHKVVKDQHAARGRFVRLEGARETAMHGAIQTARPRATAARASARRANG